MALGNVYDIESLFNTVTGPTTTRIDQIVNSEVDFGVETFLESADGVIDTVFAAVAGVSPMFSFTSKKCGTLLTTFGIDGVAIDVSLDMYLKKRSLGGTHSGGSDHIKATLTDGIIVPVSATAGQRELATVSYNVRGVSSDGTTAPLALATASLPSGSASFDEGFVAGPLTVNGSSYAGIDSYDIDFGVSTEELGADGEAYDTFTSLVGRQVRVTVRSKNAALASTIGVGGVAIGASDAIFYFRKVQEDGTRVADGTAEHLKFTINDGYIPPESISVSQGSSGDFSFSILATWDETNNAIIPALSAIS